MEEDYSNANASLSLTRAYNSLFGQNMGMGYGWSSPFHKRVEINYILQLRDGTGRGEPFTCANGTCVGDVDTHLILTPDASGYTLTRRDGASERYSLTGKLLSETSLSGQPTNYFYLADGKLDYLTDSFGHTLTFAYKTNEYGSDHVSTVTDPAGQVIRYIYNTTNNINNLVQVNYPDNTAKLYYYEDTINNPHGLTGIAYATVNTDGSLSNVSRYSTYGYYYNGSNFSDPNNGKAIRTEHAPTDNGVAQERFVLNYDTATQTTVTDPVSAYEVMTFQTNLGVKNLTGKQLYDSGGTAVNYTLQQKFDANNNLLCRKDEEGRVTTYTYNPTNQRETLTEGLAGDCSNPPTSASNTPVTRIIYYKYLSPTLDLPTEIKSPSVFAGQWKLTTIGYGNTTPGNPCYGQPLYLPCQIVQSGFTPTGSSVTRSVTLGYNTNGQVTSINGPRSPSEPGMNGLEDVTTLEYYECATGRECGQLRKVTNALNHVTNYNSYDANGRVTQITDPNGLVTVYEYDPRGRVRFIRQTPPGGGTRVTEYTYKPWGDIDTFTTPDGIKLTYGYDDAHYLRTVTDNVDNKITYHYDLKGNRDEEKFRDPDGTLVRTLTYQSDLRNRLKQIDAAGSITQLVFDAVGNLRSETDPNNNPSTTHTPDALNRLVQTIDRMNGQTDYGYDVNDRLKQVTAPGTSGNRATTQYLYDDLGNLLQETSPDRGPTSYTYDAAGNVKTLTDARGGLATYTYDALNRLTFLDYPFANDDITWRYDACALGRGRLCQALAVGGNRGYGYDAYGNVTDLSYQISSVNYVVHYGYDAGNRVTTITYPSGMVITYTYNTGRIQKITRTAGGLTTILVSDRAYRADGLVKGQLLGNGLPEVRYYDLQGRLTNQTVGNVYGRTYPFYDPNGNLKQLVANPVGGQYDYDPLDRLKQDTPTGAGSAHAFDYDGNGNRKLDNAVSYVYAPNTNRLDTLGGASMSYDAAGNIQTDAFGRSFTYDEPGHLKTATVNHSTTTYAYNAFGQRTLKTRPNLASVYYYTGLNGELLAETDGGGAPIVEYVYADQEPIAQIRYAPDPGSTPPPPTVTGFWPGAGVENTAVFVFGSGFVAGIGATTVKINGINAPIMQVLSPDLLLFLLPAGNTHGAITVTTAQGSATSASNFGTALAGVQITGLWPAQGQVGTFAFVFGSGFVAGQTVKVNQTPAPIVQVLDPSLFFVMVPPGATTGPISVTTPQGSATSAASFTVFGTSVPANTTVTYLHTDHLGTPRAGTDQGGKVVWRWEGSAAGDTAPNQDPDGNGVATTVNLRRLGEYWDSESSLTYNGARYFDSKLDRYLTPDPIGLAGGLNPYAHLYNNPLRYVDPSGLSGIDTLYMDDKAPLVVLGRNFGGLAAYIEGIATNNPALANAAAEGLMESRQANIDTLALLATLGRGRTSGEMCRVPNNGNLVIGRGADLAKPGALGPGEYKLGWPSKLPDWRAEWQENAGRLREAMGQGNPIRDASPGNTGGRFLNAERNLLENRGWTFDRSTNYWNPPSP